MPYEAADVIMFDTPSAEYTPEQKMLHRSTALAHREVSEFNAAIAIEIMGEKFGYCAYAISDWLPTEPPTQSFAGDDYTFEEAEAACRKMNSRSGPSWQHSPLPCPILYSRDIAEALRVLRAVRDRLGDDVVATALLPAIYADGDPLMSDPLDLADRICRRSLSLVRSRLQSSGTKTLGLPDQVAKMPSLRS